MSWLKIDDGFAEHDKIADVSDRAFRLHVVALCYSARNLTDGFLDERAVRVCCAVINAARPRRYVAELVTAELWLPEEDGYRIKGYLEYNPEASTVKAERQKARLRMQGLRKRRSGEGSDEQTGERAGESSPEGSGEGSSSPSRPVPAMVKSSAVNGPAQFAAPRTAPRFQIPDLLKSMEDAA